MKGTFKSYDKKTGKGVIQGPPSLGEKAEVEYPYSYSTQEKEGSYGQTVNYEFAVPLAYAATMRIPVGSAVEFDVSTSNPREATNLRY